ncbi:hypothetical protein BJ912DRAFT_925361 [Pholiota molesta]|nr:hypothetical protein BJ912DRAFT_925361 [Pholiota molesta]
MVWNFCILAGRVCPRRLAAARRRNSIIETAPTISNTFKGSRRYKPYHFAALLLSDNITSSSTLLRIKRFQIAPLLGLICRFALRFIYYSAQSSNSPLVNPFPVASSYVNIIPVASSNNYTIAILSDKPGLLKLKDQLLSSSLRAIQFLPQLKHSSAEVKGAFLVCAGPHGDDMHCTARVFQGDQQVGIRKYVGGVHFFLDERKPTYRRNRNNLKWTRRTFESQQDLNCVTILDDTIQTCDDNSNSVSSK